MTKEEYQKLLQSDYWKGYSYSLIKERDFTCEDCGRSFPNERNKLQVHHLVYRDVNPWSYKPEEVVVLCEECHKKRHGLYVEEKPAENESYISESSSTTTSIDSYEHHNTTSPRNDDIYKFIDYTQREHKADKRWNRGLLLAAGLAVTVMLAVHFWPEQKPIVIMPEETPKNINSGYEDPVPAKLTKPTKRVPDPEVRTQRIELESLPTDIDLPDAKAVVSSESSFVTGTEKESIATSQPEISQDPAREKTTLEILEERNHASVVEQAKRAGVSTKGTTSEILDRINHASVVKQAQRAGVSTEGTTSEILDRINHASVVKQAQRAGVSTEGTTSEILDRINRKSMEKYGY